LANTTPDDVALLKQELAQFLLAEIAADQGGASFRKEVGTQVAAAIDRILDERLKPMLDNIERQAAEQARRTTAMTDDALRRLKAAAPATDPAATEQKLADITARLDELRQRLGRIEEAARPPRGPVATAQPLQPRTEPRLADERLAVPATSGAGMPRWLVLLLLLIIALLIAGLGNLYYEKFNTPAPTTPMIAAPSVTPPSPASALPATTPPAATSTDRHSDAAPPAERHADASPPQRDVVPPLPAPITVPTVTPRPAPNDILPAHDTTPPPAAAPHARAIPADFAIERGWLAAQPYAVEPKLARRVGTAGAYPTLKSIVCGRSPNCTSDALMSDGVDGKQLIALQMLMSQIGDRFCNPRKSLAVTGLVSADGLADLAAIAKCAGGAPVRCAESQSTVCPPDADALQSGSQAARAQLLRWALWKTGST
jgi:hypothetical protein